MFNYSIDFRLVDLLLERIGFNDSGAVVFAAVEWIVGGIDAADGVWRGNRWGTGQK